MKRLSSVANGARAVLVEHFEVFLTAAGGPDGHRADFLRSARGEQGLAHVFLLWLQGFLIWSVHRHAWFRRRALIEKLRLMLQDRVNNQLTVMLGDGGDAQSRDDAGGAAGHGDCHRRGGRTVAHELETLSLDSLRSWERRPLFLRGTRL